MLHWCPKKLAETDCACTDGRVCVGESSKGSRLVSGCVGFGISDVSVIWDCWWGCTVLWNGGSEVPAVDVVAVVVVAVELLLM